MFGAGGGTSSYEEVEQTDLIVLWGSNARAAHPIFFHHVLKGMQRGAKLVVVDPRRTESAAFADLWLGIDVGTDVALSNTIAREIIQPGWRTTPSSRSDHRASRSTRQRRGLDAGARRGGHWGPRRGDPRGRARVRERRPRA